MTEPTPQPEEPGRPTLFFGRPPVVIFRSLLRLMVFLIVTWLLWWVAARLMSPFFDLIVLSALSLGAVAVVTTFMMMRIYELKPFYMVGLFPNRTGFVHLGLGLALGAGSSLAIVMIQWVVGWIRFERTPADPGGWATVALGFAVLLIGATGEELLFRGYAFQHLICAFGPWFSIISTSGLFALAHAANPGYTRVGMVNTALFGIVFGYAYWRTRDLWLPLGMHFAWNFSLACAGVNVSGLRIKLMGVSAVSIGPPLWSGAEYGPEASLLATFVLIGIGIGIWRAPLGRQEPGITCG